MTEKGAFSRNIPPSMVTGTVRKLGTISIKKCTSVSEQIHEQQRKLSQLPPIRARAISVMFGRSLRRDAQRFLLTCVTHTLWEVALKVEQG